MIRILIDSSSDYLMEEIQENNFELVPISIVLNGETYIDGKNLERNQFYEIMAETKAFPQTSQPSPQAFLDIFRDAKEQQDDVICILLSSALSGTYQSAMLAKQMVDYERIFLIDSLSATFCIKMMADYAQQLVQNGMSAEQIVGTLENFKSHVKVIAALDTLEYLARGGRISQTVATIGNLANLKPIITLSEDGKVEMIGKCLGKNKAISAILQKLQETDIDTDFPMYSIYSYGEENCELFRKKLEQKGIHTETPMQIGPTIGTHIGPGAFGVVFVTR